MISDNIFQAVLKPSNQLATNPPTNTDLDLRDHPYFLWEIIHALLVFLFPPF